MPKSILVHADASSATQQRIDDALALARRHNGHVTALFNLPMQRFISTDPFGGTYLAAEALRKRKLTCWMVKAGWPNGWAVTMCRGTL